MKYLVLKPLKIFGERYERGDIIEDAQVRCARILIGERKITPVLNDVSSSISPADTDTTVEPEEAATVAPENTEVSDDQQEVKEVKKPVRLSFAKEG
jgi:hypothetical protein